ncbi:MAG TPA: FAD-dependent oxidoreductase [Dehalococcoidales bacterium]|nr:FAD-dependent oxidoreductase [Dehalococcoidales bacterium]
MYNSRNFDTDILVVGGGVAGVSAALSAARGGARTILLESQTSLGGLATNGYVTGVAGMVEGNCKEWMQKMDAGGSLIDRPHLPAIDPEKGKIILESMLVEAGVKILYGTYATDTQVQDNTLKAVICHSKSGRLLLSAQMVIDATGDADVAAYAGVPCEVGSPQFAGLNMSTTLAFRMACVNLRRYSEAGKEWLSRIKTVRGVGSTMSLFSELQEKAVKNGDLPYFIFPTALIYPVPSTTQENADICVMTTHSFFTRNLDVEDLTRQIIEQHQQIGWMEKFFQKYVPGFENSRLTGIANLHGVRDSRRIVGEYTLTDEDVVFARKFEDGIAKFPEFLDTHHPTSRTLGFMRHIHIAAPEAPAVCRPAQCSGEMHPFGQLGGFEARVNPLDYCEIPYRSLVPLKIDNLLVVGRCVSAEFNAIAAVRVIAPSMSTGQAAAVAAVLCIKDKIRPRELDGKLVRQTLIQQGVRLNEAPDGHWADVKKVLKGEFVVMPGDFVGVQTPEGIKTHM